MTATDADNGTKQIAPTEMLYYTYEGNFEYECHAKVLDVRENPETNRLEVILDKTVLHAQGGGQPTDTGTISSPDNNTVFIVEKVTMDRASGVTIHAGKLEDGSESFPVGSEVHVAVDVDKRRLHSECHTAGHVVDSAMARCGKGLKAHKAYHFMEGPYVEYKGSIPPEEKESLLLLLQQAFKDLIEEDIQTKIELLTSKETTFDMKEFGGEEGDDAKIRIVTVAGLACPCGGTHIKSTADLKENKWGITGFKSKKGVVRVRYAQNSA